MYLDSGRMLKWRFGGSARGPGACGGVRLRFFFCGGRERRVYGEGGLWWGRGFARRYEMGARLAGCRTGKNVKMATTVTHDGEERPSWFVTRAGSREFCYWRPWFGRFYCSSLARLEKRRVPKCVHKHMCLQMRSGVQVWPLALRQVGGINRRKSSI